MKEVTYEAGAVFLFFLAEADLLPCLGFLFVCTREETDDEEDEEELEDEDVLEFILCDTGLEPIPFPVCLDIVESENRLLD